MTYLADVNVWIALTVIEHPHHDQAIRWFQETMDEDHNTAFCRVTQSGFFRLLTNPNLMRQNVFNAREVWTIYDKWLDLKNVTFAGEPPQMERIWRLGTQNSTGHKFWTDVYIAAFAAAPTPWSHSIELFRNLRMETCASYRSVARERFSRPT
jgi:toxin-antitoxin system PIN domain toxin